MIHCKRLFSAALVSSSCLLFVGCAADATATSDPADETEIAQTEQAYYYLSSGFYKTPQTGDKVLAVWQNYYCWVLDPGEWAAIAITNGWGQNTANVSLYAIAEGRAGSSTTWCQWPNGMLRRGNEAEVYLIQNGRSCHLLNAEQVAHHGGWSQVWNAPADSKFTWVTYYDGSCTW
jgi:hypothetical protein